MLVPIYTFLPLWAQNGGTAKMLSNISDDWLAKRITKEMDTVPLKDIVVAEAPGNDFFVGRSLADIRDTYGLSDEREAMVRLMRETRLRGIMLTRVIDEDLASRALASPRSFVASNAPSFGPTKGRKQLKTERTTSTFGKFLSLAERGLLPLADAVRKITREPAREFGLSGRGEIGEGNFADLTCFKNGEFKFTIVNGRIAVREGEFQNVFPGRALRRAGTK
jgi:N-acyl-D-amino-acid deacylase